MRPDLSCLLHPISQMRRSRKTNGNCISQGSPEETEPIRYLYKRELSFKELAHVTVGMANLKSIGPEGRLDIQVTVDIAV